MNGIVGPTAKFIESALALPECLDCQSLSELLLLGRPGCDPGAAALLGTIGERQVSIGLGVLRSVIVSLADALTERDLRPGDTVCLIRLPRTTELMVAVAYAALTAAGIRVLLPMYSEPQALRQWLVATHARAVLWNAREVHIGGCETDRLRQQRLERHLQDLGLPALCLEGDLGLSRKLCDAAPGGPSPNDPRLQCLLASGGPETECLILTTAGTSGNSKLVRYCQSAFLRSCLSWEAAGLYQPERLGGRGLCLLFSHSMGIRAFWNAIWTGQALCMIPPEWFLEHPERVRALLLQMRPEHVTGGPAVFSTLLELARVFPDLKEHGLTSLRCAVSCGAPFDADVARRLDAALGLDLHNAYGTTETLQVLSSLVGESTGGSAMGHVLPGVRIALEPLGGESRTCRLKVNSPFGYAGYLSTGGGEETEPAPYWFATGDLVRPTANGLCYLGREQDEYVKDGFGVKISRRVLAERYANLGNPVLHLEWFRLREEPGLGALIFVGDRRENTAGDRRVSDRRILERVRALVEARHESFRLEVDDFELRHLTIARFACLEGPPPLTSKGNVSRASIERRQATLLDELLGRYVKHPGIVRLDRDWMPRSNSTLFVRPRLGKVLQLLRMDKTYTSARGDRLTLVERGRQHEVVDFVGGFGATLLGHRHPEILGAARRFLDGDAVPVADQGSDRPVEGAFARRLAKTVSRHTGGSYVVRLGSTGAEAVEIALAHAMLEHEEGFQRFLRDQRRLFGGNHPERVTEIIHFAREAVRGSAPIVLAIAGGFHGHSLGARSVSELRNTRTIFAPMTRIEAVFLPPDDDVDLDQVVRDAEFMVPALAWQDGRVVEKTFGFSRIICAIVEPILGEGGVAVVSPALLARLARYDFPLVLDEIQCGLGRSGRFLASDGVRGDYYLLGKALGGGVAKISAVLIDRARYVERFDEYYAGTFAGDAFSCAVASAVLDVIEDDDVARRASDRGDEIQRRLDKVRRDFPAVIRQVSGAGLMLGVELAPSATESLLVRMALEREWLGMLAATYLLNRWSVRVLPTLSAPNTLRVEPSVYIDDSGIAALEQGMRAFCAAVESRDLCEVLSVLVEDDMALGEMPVRERGLPQFSGRIEPPEPGATRVAFLNHFVLPDRELVFIEPTLARLSPTARRALVHRLVGLMDLEPTVAFARNLFGGRVYFVSILLPVDPATLEEFHRSGERELVVQRIQEALELAQRLGCTVGGLGAYTSIVTADGTAILAPPGMKLSTGNALTVAIGVHRVSSLCRRRGIDPTAASSRLGILGASGSIGSALAHGFVCSESPFRRILLVGRQQDALEAVADRARAATSGFCDVEVSTRLSSLRGCNVVAAATGTNEPLIYPQHLAPSGPVIVADVSVPSIVAARTRELRHVHVVPLAGNVTVPGTPDFAMASHIAPGTAFSCAGESMLVGLASEETSDLVLVGPVKQRSVVVLEALARRWGLLDAPPAAAANRGGV
jgi:acetylornithine/succinyldiaminopimelate/putrescine aminotransferase/predicted amino acid dehydrogenase/acyl-coenzyme A synthetase/AMP-(fatty) acid ligase